MNPEATDQNRSLPWLRIVGFGSVFLLLQVTWSVLEGSAVWRTWMETLNVSVATMFVGYIAGLLPACLLNAARITGLFFTWRTDSASFD